MSLFRCPIHESEGGDDTVGNPHRAPISQFELLERILLVNWTNSSLSSNSRQVERFEPIVPQSAVQPPLNADIVEDGRPKSQRKASLIVMMEEGWGQTSNVKHETRDAEAKRGPHQVELCNSRRDAQRRHQR